MNMIKDLDVGTEYYMIDVLMFVIFTVKDVTSCRDDIITETPLSCFHIYLKALYK
jgi:hypothetical protein